MENANEKVISVLEKLIETCRDGQNGYRDAAEHTKSPQLRQFFNQQSIERAQFAGQLENELIHLGDHDPERNAEPVRGDKIGGETLDRRLMNPELFRAAQRLAGQFDDDAPVFRFRHWDVPPLVAADS